MESILDIFEGSPEGVTCDKVAGEVCGNFSNLWLILLV